MHECFDPIGISLSPLQVATLLHCYRPAIQTMKQTEWFCITDCSSPEIEFSVNSKAVDSGASLTVGDVITCSAEGASAYRWNNGAGRLTHGQKVIISQPGTFSYKCNVFMDCDPGLICPFSRIITGHARGYICAVLFETTQLTDYIAYSFSLVAVLDKYCSMIMIMLVENFLNADCRFVLQNSFFS